MRADTILLKAKGEDLKKVENALTFQKDIDGLHSNHNRMLSCRYESWIFMRFVILTHGLIRFFYKAIYFYLFPYLIVPVSYLLYNVHTDIYAPTYKKPEAAEPAKAPAPPADKKP